MSSSATLKQVVLLFQLLVDSSLIKQFVFLFLRSAEFAANRRSVYDHMKHGILLYFLGTSRIAQYPAVCDVVMPLFSISGFLSL